MNPLDAFRTDVHYLDPLQRSRMLGALDDARTAREQELTRYDAADRAEAQRQQQYAVERSELASQGYTNRELAEHQRTVADRKAERIQELRDELERLDPNQRATARRTQSDIDTELLLRKARDTGNSPFMRRMCAELEQREEVRRAQVERQRIERAARELSR